jgi:hypothetical protein
MRTAWMTSLSLVALGSVALAAVPLEMPLQGVVRDNAGNPANGEFEVTFALYPAADSEGVDALWWNTQNITVVDGHFVTRLGEGKALDPADFSGGSALWLGMAIESEDELPRRPLGSSATALHAATAAGLDCSGCVGLQAITAAAQSGIVDQALAAVSANGYTTVASGLYYDDGATEVEAADVQTAIEKLKELIDENAANGGGGGDGNVNEGAGQVIAYQKNDTIDANGTFKQYVHLVNPATAKVVMYLYGEADEGGDQAYLNPDPQYIADPVETGQMTFDTHSHGGGYSPKYDEFWYPQWSGSTIYIHDVETGAQQGSFSCGYSDMMQLWGNIDGTYYTANWSNDRIRKWSDKGANLQWERYISGTAGGVCENGKFVYGMRNGSNTVYQLDIDTGNIVDTWVLPGNPAGTLHGGLVCVGNRLYRGAESQVRVYDLDTKEHIDTFNVSENIYNMAFDGTTMWISANDSSLRGYQLVEESVYQHIRAPKSVEIHVDGVNVTPLIGDPNGKGSPHFNDVTGVWGENGKDPWSSGILDVTNVADWTLGEHTVELKETGGLGGTLQSYIYVIYPFTESTPPDNDTCSGAEALDPEAGDVVTSGTTEDIMGKSLATDANQAVGCGGIGGSDVVYSIELTARALLNAALVAPFPAKLYLREGACADGEVVYCALDEFTTNPLEPGTYYLIIDADTPGAKGDFNLAVSVTPAPLPENDTCETATELILSAAGDANIQATTLYSLDQTKGFCAAALDGGPDVVYTFSAGTGQSVTATVTADFDTILYLTWQQCGGDGIPLGCSDNGTLNVGGLAGGDYWLIIDGEKEKEWGAFDLSVSVQ